MGGFSGGDYDPIARADAAAAQADATQALADAAAAQGDATQAIGDAAAAQGDATQAIGDAAAAQGDATQAIGDAAAAQATADLRGETEQLTFTRDLTLASGNVDYTIPSGRAPKWIEVRCGSTGAGNSNGFSSGVAASCTCTHGNGVFGFRSAYCVEVGDTGSAYQLAGIATLSAGNVRLPWTKVGSPVTTVSGVIVCHF